MTACACGGKPLPAYDVPGPFRVVACGACGALLSLRYTGGTYSLPPREDDR